MMWVDTTYRSKEVEIMDDLDMTGDLLISTLDKIAQINKWLGGNGLTLNGVKKILKGYPKGKVISILDLGCGNGDMLRMLADYGSKNDYKFDLLGIDANQTTINHAIALSSSYENISYEKKDVFSESFDAINYDVALSTLFLHHFEDDVVVGLIEKWINKASIGVVINDLHRHPVAYYLFKLLASLIGNKMVTTDGLISILRGFKRGELETFASRIGYHNNINWRWAFRYQWIIKKQ